MNYWSKNDFCSLFSFLGLACFLKTSVSWKGGSGTKKDVQTWMYKISAATQGTVSYIASSKYGTQQDMLIISLIVSFSRAPLF